jgi:protein SCO1
MKTFFKALFFLLFTASHTIGAQYPDFGLEPNSGAYIEPDIFMINADSEKVSLTDQIDKTTILNLVYYNCTQQCPKVLKGINELIAHLPLRLGHDYQIFTIGFNKNGSLDEMHLVREQQRAQAKGTAAAGDGWEFYMLDQENIDKLSENLGYHFYHKDGNYMHAAFLTVISPKGKIINYMYGTQFLVSDFEITYLHALDNEVRGTVPRNLKYCTNYIAPAHHQLHRIAVISGLLVVVSALALFLTLVIKKPSKNYPV